MSLDRDERAVPADLGDQQVERAAEVQHGDPHTTTVPGNERRIGEGRDSVVKER